VVHHGKMTRLEAARLVCNGRLVHEHDRTAKLLDAGDMEQFRTVARRWQTIAEDRLDREPTKAFEQRHLHCSVTFQGRVRLDGVLDPEGGARVVAALNALMDPDASRPAAQRRAVRVRDGGWVFPGCHAPSEWCDVHDLHGWADTGGTDQREPRPRPSPPPRHLPRRPPDPPTTTDGTIDAIPP
jgi:hypothetical protein